MVTLGTRSGARLAGVGRLGGPRARPSPGALAVGTGPGPGPAAARRLLVVRTGTAAPTHRNNRII